MYLILNQKFSELVAHFNDATLYIPNYINKGYQTDINGKEVMTTHYLKSKTEVNKKWEI
jgi:hypothetical protein